MQKQNWQFDFVLTDKKNKVSCEISLIAETCLQALVKLGALRKEIPVFRDAKGKTLGVTLDRIHEIR